MKQPQAITELFLRERNTREGRRGLSGESPLLPSPIPHPSSPKDFRLVGRPRERSPSPRQVSGLKGALLGKCPPQRPPFQGSSAGRRCLAHPISASAAHADGAEAKYVVHMAHHKGLCTGLGGLWGGMAHGAASNGLQEGRCPDCHGPPKTGEGIFRNRPAKPLVAAVLCGHWLNMGTSAMPSGMGGIIPRRWGP